MQPYVIRQGDHLLGLAYRFGFDADPVWNHPKNAELRQLQKLSSDPNVLNPTDMLYIPDSKPPVMQDVAIGTTNTFVSDAPTAALNVRFTEADGTPYASMAFNVPELPELTGLATNGDGLATFQVPVTLETATVVFSDSGDTFPLAIGEMDPIDTLSGIFKRLVNLGYIDPAVALDSTSLDVLRAGLQALKAVKSASDDPPPSSAPEPDSSPPSTPAADDSAPPSDPDGAGGDDADGDDGSDDDGSDDDGSDDDGDDDAGLADDGTLDPDTRSLLLKAYGS